jgi:hypothetical protein
MALPSIRRTPSCAQPLDSHRKPFDQLQSRFNIRDRLRVGTAIHRLLAGQEQILDRLAALSLER